MKAIIFDMDGVIIDSEPIHIRLDQIMFKELAIEIDDEELERYIGVTSFHMWSDMKRKYGIEKTVEELLEKGLALKIENLAREEVEPISGVIEVINYAKESGLKLAVASSSPEVYIHSVLDKFGIKDDFDIIVSGQHVENSKPAPDIFLRAARLINVLPEECIVIEDSTHGVAAAKAAGMMCIGFNNINSKNQNISKADIKVDDINHIVIKLSQI